MPDDLTARLNRAAETAASPERAALWREAAGAAAERDRYHRQRDAAAAVAVNAAHRDVKDREGFTRMVIRNVYPAEAARVGRLVFGEEAPCPPSD